MAFECGDATIADIFACLWFTKVVSCYLYSSAITDAGEGQQKIGAVVTSGVVGSRVYLAEVWLESF